MKLQLLSWVLLVGMSSGVFANILPPEPSINLPNQRALNLEVRGKNGGFDSAAYGETRRQISESVADGTIDRFVVYRYYDAGGFAACIELSLGTLPIRLRELQSRFLTIQYDANNTAFYVGTGTHCR